MPAMLPAIQTGSSKPQRCGKLARAEVGGRGRGRKRIHMPCNSCHRSCKEAHELCPAGQLKLKNACLSLILQVVASCRVPLAQPGKETPGNAACESQSLDMESSACTDRTQLAIQPRCPNSKTSSQSPCHLLRLTRWLHHLQFLSATPSNAFWTRTKDLHGARRDTSHLQRTREELFACLA